jgi:hypothetical protein
MRAFASGGRGRRRRAGGSAGTLRDPYSPSIEEGLTLQHEYAAASSSSSNPHSHRGTVTLSLSEVGGHPAFRSLLPSAIEAADAIVCVYDVGDATSWEAVWAYVQCIAQVKGTGAGPLPPLLLLGNQLDTITGAGNAGNAGLGKPRRERQVRREDGAALAARLGVQFAETTAMAPMSVRATLSTLIQVALAVGAGAAGDGPPAKGDDAPDTAPLRNPPPPMLPHPARQEGRRPSSSAASSFASSLRHFGTLAAAAAAATRRSGGEASSVMTSMTSLSIPSSIMLERDRLWTSSAPSFPDPDLGLGLVERRAPRDALALDDDAAASVTRLHQVIARLGG